METLTVRSLQFEILAALASSPRANRFNLLGRSSERGDLERRIGIPFEGGQRSLADIAFQELRAGGFIRSTYADLIDPDSWVEITDSGRRALKHRCLDSLDEALATISPALVELRHGAWSALASGRPDSLRQAAHSAREMIDQVLKTGAPDAEVRLMPGFKPDPTSRSGITRRHRLQYLMNVRQGAISTSDLRIVEQACDLVLAVDEQLIALSHARAAPPSANVKDSLTAGEIALRRVLSPGN